MTAYGDAPDDGSLAGPLNAPVVGIAADPTGGYWLVGSDGGIYAFGGAPFYGSLGGTRLERPVVGMAATANGGGYRLLGSDGGVFSFGGADYFGSAGNLGIDSPMVGMAAVAGNGGYWMTTADGTVYAFGDATGPAAQPHDLGGSQASGLVGTPTGRGYSLVDLGVLVHPTGDASLFPPSS